jgi:heme-degrading monooxygenase HmoA
MYARVNRFRLGDQDIDETTRIAEDKLVPQVRALPGFAGLQSLVNRSTREELTITFWETEEAMRDSEGGANRLRGESADLTGTEIVSVERYEVVLRVEP